MERKITFKQAINEALSQEMERDKTVILMGEDVAGGSGNEIGSEIAASDVVQVVGDAKRRDRRRPVGIKLCVQGCNEEKCERE